MSSTGRPRRPPFLLISSFQICIASSAGLPLAESPPVSAMPRPILIGSAARARKAGALASANAAMMMTIRALVTSCRDGCFMLSSLSAPVRRGRAGRSAGQDCPRRRGVVKALGTDAVHHGARIEYRLLGAHQVVVGHAVEHGPPDRNQRIGHTLVRSKGLNPYAGGRRSRSSRRVSTAH